MVGAIGKWEVLSHPVVTVSSFGWRVFLKTLVAGRNQTFLSILAAAGQLQGPAEPAFDVIRRCIRLELGAKRIYENLARQFGEFRAVVDFFATLARQEQEHAELLDLCRIAVRQGQWQGDALDPLREALPRVEFQLREMDSSVASLGSVVEAFRLVFRIESTEINRLYSGVVAASDSEFVRTVAAFRNAGREHLDYITRRIPELEPSLASDCRTFRDQLVG